MKFVFGVGIRDWVVGEIGSWSAQG